MKGDTIVDFPNFNFRLCYEWIIDRSRTLCRVTLANQLSVTFRDLLSSWVTLAKQFSVTFADLQTCLSTIAKMRKTC